MQTAGGIKSMSRDQALRTKPIRQVPGNVQDAPHLFKLLVSAFLDLYCANQPCALALLDCASEFRRRHGISDSAIAGSTPWMQMNGANLVRLLTYVKEEAIEALQDERCAEDLGQCITRLMTIYHLPDAQLFNGKS